MSLPRHQFDRRVVGWWRSQLAIATAVVVAPLLILGLLIEPARTWLFLLAAIMDAGVVTPLGSECRTSRG